MKKKSLAAILAMVCAVAVTACGGSTGSAPAENPETTGETAEEETVPESGAAVVEISFGHDNNPGDPVQEAALFWAEKLDELSGGTMKLNVYPSGQLGNKSDLMDQLLAGDTVACIGNGPFYADRGAADLGIMNAPYLFESWEQLDKLVASDWYGEQMGQLENAGIKIIASNWRYGVRHTETVNPVTSPADIQGMKIRTQNTTIHVKGFECLGATPTPMALSDVYTSLQQGTIDGLENPISVLYSGAYYEVAKNLMLDGHIRDLSSICISADVFNSLTEEQQGWLMESCEAAGEYQNELAQKADEECLQKMKDAGVTVNEVSTEDFKAAAESFYSVPEIQAMWSEGLVDTVKSIIQ